MKACLGRIAVAAVGIFFLLQISLLRTAETITAKTKEQQEIKQKDERSSERYLLYLTHSGYSNQILGLRKAIYLAIATNRTLVLPPILPHVTMAKKRARIQPRHDALLLPFAPRAVGSGCTPAKNYKESIRHIERDVQTSKRRDALFPSHQSLLDLDSLRRNDQVIGFKFMDMDEYSKSKDGHVSTQDPRRWCKVATNKELSLQMVQNCALSNSTFPDVVSSFSRFCGPNRVVAVIGSGYALPFTNHRESLDANTASAIDNFFHKLPLTPKLQEIVKQLYSLVSKSGYFGLHVRFRDNLVIHNCSEVTETYTKVFSRLNESNGLSPSTAKHHLLVGNSNKAVLRCFRYHDQEGRYHATTINEIIDKNDELKALIDAIVAVPKSTVYLLLDMVLLSLAENVVLATQEDGYAFESTFQSIIQDLHVHRESTLEKLGIHSP